MWELQETSKLKLKSFQYNAARAIFNTSCKPATEALIGDLGWASILETMEKHQVNYFNYLTKTVPRTSLPHRILKVLMDKFKSAK